MTEIGMALSNPLAGERRPGFVGTPLPGVEVRLVDEQGARRADGTPGELEVRGPASSSSTGSGRRRRATAFRDGWFRTGDVAVLEDGVVPAARPHQRRHHQDRRLQGVGARDRGGAAHAPGDCRVRRRRRRRRGVGRAGVGGGRAARRGDAVARGPAAVGEGPAGALQDAAGAAAVSTRCRATRWARSSSRRLPRSLQISG